MTFKEKTRQHINDDLIFSNLEKYVEMIENKNKVMNLTGFKDDVLWEEGIYESIISLEAAFDVEPNKRLLDIGAGVGFPSIPFKIVHPEIELTIYESLGKRVKFLKEVSEELILGIDVQNIRVESSKQYEYFDYITARAVSELKVIIEASSQLGRLGSSYAFIKGPRGKEELKLAAWIIKDLGINIELKEVPKIENKEVFIAFFIKKQTAPAKYPRDWATIIKKR